MSEQPARLFDRFGGADGIAAIVRDMYDRVLADPELAPFFEKTSMQRLHRMQYEFVAAALDGPVVYTGAELTEIHKGRGITPNHFAQFFGHFADACEAHEVDKRDLDEALGRLALYRDQITGDANIDG